MRFVLLALFLVLVGCDGETPPPADSGVVADDGGVDGGLPVPVCRPLSEIPSCEGDCDALAPRCPPGWKPVCGPVRWAEFSCNISPLTTQPDCRGRELDEAGSCTEGEVGCLAPNDRCSNDDGF